MDASRVAASSSRLAASSSGPKYRMAATRLADRCQSRPLLRTTAYHVEATPITQLVTRMENARWM